MRSYIRIFLKDNQPQLEVVRTDKIPTLSDLQDAVDGYIEPFFTVESPSGGERLLTGYVNEEGLLIESMPIFTGVIYQTGQKNMSLAGNSIIVALKPTEDGPDTDLLTDIEEKAILRCIDLHGVRRNLAGEKLGGAACVDLRNL